MRVLFVASGNSAHFDISPFTKAQGESLRQEGVEVHYFPVVGRGVFGYLKNVPLLKSVLREQSYDLIHAHYSLCGWVAVLGAAGKIPVVLSLLGDDAQGTFVGKNKVGLKSRLLVLFARMIQPFVQGIIYKSANLGNVIFRKKIGHLVPNGVRLSQFQIYPGGCRKDLGLDDDRQYVLFLGNPADPNKNAALAEAAVKILGKPEIELLKPYPVPHDTVVKYLNSVDVFVLCSFGEGSPNVVKEAMACNCPMVVTDVGDAAWVVGDTPGCYVAAHEPAVFANALSKALAFSKDKGRTLGRERLRTIGLDARSVARRLLEIYQSVLSEKHTATSVQEETSEAVITDPKKQ